MSASFTYWLSTDLQMSNTHVYGILGASHVRGHEAGDAEFEPKLMAPLEQELVFLAAHGLSVGDTIEQTVLAVIDVRARVVAIPASNRVIVEPLIASTGTAYPAAVDGERRILWDTYSTLTVNGGVSALQIIAYSDSQFAEQMADSELSEVTEEKTYWDSQARLARTIAISGFSRVSPELIYPGDTLSASGGGDFQVIGISNVDLAAETATLHVVKESGTLTGTLTSDHSGITLTGVTIDDAGTATTAGEWVQYCAVPNLNLMMEGIEDESDGILGSIWDVPPRGNRTGGTDAQLGPDAKIVHRAVEAHEGAEELDDRGVRVIQHCSNDSSSDGWHAGVTYQKVTVNTLSSAFTIGEVVSTGSGPTDWSAEIAGMSEDGLTLYVWEVNGQTLNAADTITGADSGETAIADGQALGWQPGSLYWDNFLADLADAEAHGDWLHLSAARKWERVFLMIWEGELAPYGNIHNNSLGALDPAYLLLVVAATNQDKLRNAWLNFCTELRTELGNDDMPIRAWINHSGAQNGVQAWSTGEGFITSGVRASLSTLPEYIDNFTIVDSELRGHLMATQVASGSIPWIRPMDYVDLGTAFWNGSSNLTITAPVGDYEVLAIGVVSGSQSQMHASNIYNTDPMGASGSGVAYIDDDAELYPSASFVYSGANLDTTDPNALVWNHQTNDLEVFDVALNENTFWRPAAAYTNHGPMTPVMQRMKMRFGDGTTSGKFALFKASVGGSCYHQDVRNADGCWHPDLEEGGRPTDTVSVTVTHSGDRAIFTSAGAFGSRMGTDYTVVISGGEAVQGVTNGRNTPQYVKNLATSITEDKFELDDPDGDIADGTETLTFSWGPPPLWPEMKRQWKACITKCVEKGYIPSPVFLAAEQGESDLGYASEYSAQLDAFWAAFTELCDLREAKKGPGIAKCIVQVHQYTPFTTDPAEIATLRGAQATKAETMDDCVLVDPTPLPLEVNQLSPTPPFSSPPWPRQYRVENGIHHTPMAMITKGYMIDAALGSLTSLIPSHPNGNDGGVGIGAVNGTGTLEL